MPFEKLKKAAYDELPAELKGRAVLTPAYDVVPVIKGAGDRSFTCSKCSVTLIQGLLSNQHLSGIVIRCPKCRTYNEVDV